MGEYNVANTQPACFALFLFHTQMTKWTRMKSRMESLLRYVLALGCITFVFAIGIHELMREPIRNDEH